MHAVRTVGAAAGLVLAMVQSAQAAPLIEDFSGGLNGWSVVQTASAGAAGGTPGGGTPTIETVGGLGGNGDAWLRVQEGDTFFMHVVFGAGWTGDLSAFDRGSFSLNYIETQTVGGSASNRIASFGTMRVSGGGTSAVTDIIAAAPTTDWAGVSVDFSAATWGVSQSTWNTILVDVTEIRLQSESWIGGETVGFDNVQLAPVPLPPGSLLLLSGLGALALRRRAHG